MREVEVKILGVDREEVESRLNRLKATKILEDDVDTIFFDFPSNSISKAKNLLRLRRIGSKAGITFKKFVESDTAKVRVEYNVSVSDFEAANSILQSLGLIPTMRMEKHRTSYIMNGDVEVDIDKYTGQYSHIPTFLEVEGPNIPKIHAQAKLLGFAPEQCKPWTTFDLINHYSTK